ncbi:hypothetical protein CYMTET_27364 [Cymbomonas tetramitiformis]|uniref:Uncharacterized protein n=1 Tax=Cymbomonas tetramitiformis TaxID=36881 RepID=A0AAE0FQH0_9CHLO|nr:hypothetical protein CYMTET_27364 [Cymbomonas tetramitiformis]
MSVAYSPVLPLENGEFDFQPQADLVQVLQHCHYWVPDARRVLKAWRVLKQVYHHSRMAMSPAFVRCGLRQVAEVELLLKTVDVGVPADGGGGGGAVAAIVIVCVLTLVVAAVVAVAFLVVVELLTRAIVLPRVLLNQTPAQHQWVEQTVPRAKIHLHISDAEGAFHTPQGAGLLQHESGGEGALLQHLHDVR